MRVGFVHGVMSTDNMSVLGLTIDYGPYGWIDNYDPDWTPNTTAAANHRCAYGRQPGIALWNLACLANALVGVFASVDNLKAGLDVYRRTLATVSETMTKAKFGLAGDRTGDQELIGEAFTLLERGEVGMTCFFRALAGVKVETPDARAFSDAFCDDSLRATTFPA